MIQPLGLVFGLTADPDAQPLENLQVLFADDDGEVGLAAPESRQLLLGKIRQGVGEGGDGQGQQHLVSVEPGIPVV